MMTAPSNTLSLIVSDTSRLPWTVLEIPQTGAKITLKDLFACADTGMQVQLVRYGAGFTNIWHTHPNAHGMYVLDGVLSTHDGNYGPGSFVWFPEGGWMEHGATADNDVTFLFITNKPFAICYESDSEHPYPMHNHDAATHSVEV